MLSTGEIKENQSTFEFFDFCVEFQMDKHPRRIRKQNISEIFMGEKISIRKAICQKTLLRCFIDIGEEATDHFISYGNISLTWEPKENLCIIGVIWIKPEFRGKGIASYLLDQVTSFADELGIVVTLFALPFVIAKKRPTRKEISVIQEYYKRFGFNKSSKVSGTGFDCSMKRFPRTQSSPYIN